MVRVLRNVGGGLIASLLLLASAFSNGALIFTGPLEPFLGQGVAAALAPEFIVAPMPAEVVKGFAEPIITYAVRGVQPILSRLTRAEERDNVKHN